MTYIKESIITKLQKLYSPPGNIRAGNKSPALFLKKRSCTGDLLPAYKIFIERPGVPVEKKQHIIEMLGPFMGPRRLKFFQELVKSDVTDITNNL